MFLSCLKATGLVEKRFHVRLSFRENLQLEIHKSMCSACRMYEKQSSVLNEAMLHPERWQHNKEDLTEFKALIVQELNRRNGS